MLVLSAGQSVFLVPSLGLDGYMLPGDQPIFDHFPDLLRGVGIDDFIGLSGVKPELSVTADTHGCGRSIERQEYYYKLT